MLLRRLLNKLLRFAFHLFYNPFAFTYDWVSSLVSRGEWRAWTRAAIPRVAGPRVLEIPCGTGNLLSDLIAAGYAPVGADLSPWMLNITRGKLRKAGLPAKLIRARAQTLPFSAGAFDSIVMTFPPGLASDPTVLAEFRRVLDTKGRLVWVDAGRLEPNDLWGRCLNRALDLVGGEGNFERMAGELLERAGFEAHVEWVRSPVSVVAVVTAIKGGAC